VTDPTSGQPVVVSPEPLGLDGSWIFERFACSSGALTPWAQLENTLVGADGYKTPSFSWPTEAALGLTDSGTIRRSHLWTITDNKASRVSRLDYTSSRSVNQSEATAWTSTTKSYDLIRSEEGQLVLVHGILEKPLFQGLPLEPIVSTVQQKIKELGGSTSPMTQTIQKVTDFLKARIDSRVVDLTMSFFNDVTNAVETVDYRVDDESLVLSNAAIAIKGLPLLSNPNDPKGVRLIDHTVCGLLGKAERHYRRVQN
jgi:hypothetical protein